MPQRKRVTITDIAALAGVSPGAVSFALNGRPGVSEETRARVLQIAREAGWRPSQAARALGGARLDVLGLVVERTPRALGAEAFFADLISGIQEGLADTDVSLQLRVVPDVAEEIRTYQAWHASRQVDGVIVLDPRDDDVRWPVLTALGLPHIVLGSAPGQVGGASTVWLDDRSAASRLFDYLVAIGHRRIAYVTGPAEHQHTAMRVAVLDALADRGVEGRHVPTDFSPRAATVAVRRLLSAATPPSAIVFDNEVMAIAGLRVTQEMGAAVPGRVSLAAFDDSVISEHIHPSITSLTRDTLELGRLAARHLLAQLESDAPIPSVEGPQLELSVRESTAPPT